MIINITYVNSKIYRRYLRFLASSLFIKRNTRLLGILSHISIIIFALGGIPLLYLLIWEMLVNINSILLILLSCFIRIKKTEKYEYCFHQDFLCVKINDNQQVDIMYDDIKLIVETKLLYIIQTKEKISLTEEPYLLDKLVFSEHDYNELKNIVEFTNKAHNEKRINYKKTR